jgi:hypothetical protein
VTTVFDVYVIAIVALVERVSILANGISAIRANSVGYTNFLGFFLKRHRIAAHATRTDCGRITIDCAKGVTAGHGNALLSSARICTVGMSVAFSTYRTRAWFADVILATRILLTAVITVLDVAELVVGALVESVLV